MKISRMFGIALVAIVMGASLASCSKDENPTTAIPEQDNPVIGTVWKWSEGHVTWTFTFSDTEVIFDYRAVFGPDDITTDQYKSSYTYTSNTVTFEMNGWSGVVWKYKGTISGRTMHLVDNGTEKIDIILTKVEESKEEDPEWSGLVSGYENGVATLSTAGILKTLLGDDYLNITSLKVVGYINGDDIYYLRRMLGDSNYSTDERGNLTSLDLSQTKITEGGEYYYMDPLGQTYMTQDNVVGEYMFCLCTNSADVILPDTALSIGTRAFYGCRFNSVAIGDNVISIGKEAFRDYDYYLTSINSIFIGKGLTKIANDAFGEQPVDIYITDLSAWCNLDRECLYCRDLYLNGEKVEDLIIPEDITGIKTGTFVGCSSLTSVTIGDNVTSIGAFAFGSCSSLTSVTIGDGVKEIGVQAFYQCESLNSITIGKGCSVIESMAFLECASDGVVYCHAPIPPSINDSDYHSTFDKATGRTLYVPDRYLQSYKGSCWADFFDKIIGID